MKNFPDYWGKGFPKMNEYQDAVNRWMQACFGPAISADGIERNFRFGEEALELMQALGATEDEAMTLVRYVWSRPKGEPKQEVGGVMVCMAALCNAHGFNYEQEAQIELARCWEKIEKIRAKHAAKPVGFRTALPGLVDAAQDARSKQAERT